MTIADQGTIFQPVQQSAQQEISPSPFPAKHTASNSGTRVLAFFITLCVVVVGAVVGYYYYGLQIRERAQTLLSQTNTKIQALEANGYDVEGFYNRISGKQRKINEPTSRAFLWYLFDTEQDLEDLNTEINIEYGQIIEQERLLLDQDIATIRQQMERARNIEYPSKQEMEQFVVQVEHALEVQESSLDEVSQFRQQAIYYVEQFNGDLKKALQECNTQMKDRLAAAVNYDIPKRDAWLEKMMVIDETVSEMENEQLISEITLCENTIQNIGDIVEQARRDSVIATVNAGVTEATALQNFFAQRSGFQEQLAALQRFTQQASSFLSGDAVEASSTQMEAIAEAELYPTLEEARQTKRVIEEQERQERIAEQKRLAAENNIPVPPVDVRKLIVIDVAKQRLYAYENGISVFSQPVPVTTGKAGFDTVRGQFSIYLKTTNFRMRSPFLDIYYDNFVEYWMPFYQGYGLHDASWRSVYGTMDYPSVGSHGCVNVPYDYISQLYNWSEIGTTVLVR
jgi:lipoprotein-anchoring transpeptidase ErfK/SrfK